MNYDVYMVIIFKIVKDLIYISILLGSLNFLRSSKIHNFPAQNRPKFLEETMGILYCRLSYLSPYLEVLSHNTEIKLNTLCMKKNYHTNFKRIIITQCLQYRSRDPKYIRGSNATVIFFRSSAVTGTVFLKSRDCKQTRVFLICSTDIAT